MKKLLLTLAILVSGFISAQELSFDCDTPDATVQDIINSDSSLTAATGEVFTYGAHTGGAGSVTPGLDSSITYYFDNETYRLVFRFVGDASSGILDNAILYKGSSVLELTPRHEGLWVEFATVAPEDVPATIQWVINLAAVAIDNDN